MASKDGGYLLPAQRMFMKNAEGETAEVGPNNPMAVYIVGEGPTPIPDPEVINILGTGTAAGSADFPKDSSMKKATDITVTYGGSAANTTATFTTFLVDINGRETVLQGVRNNVSIGLVSSANVGDVVDYSIPVGCKLRIKYTAPANGTVNIKGVVG
ncbi:hypothetical protein [Paenibacillus hubeiensis]|uniref:hypothetical protein n=1 Tax=Paenibacillus hubeiensis TaxID=3077330 RepID=UPI0031BA3D9C